MTNKGSQKIAVANKDLAQYSYLAHHKKKKKEKG
jgi:hypothetical protein